MRRYLWTVCLLVLLCGSAAAKKFPLTASSVVPAARGNIQVGKDKNSNTRVKMTVEHLAKPESLSPPKTAYVVWLQQKGSEPENQGQLRVSGNLKASFETTTPAKNFDLFVTGEQDPSTKTPAGLEVLRATVQP
jgi:hypothetical protein